MTMKFAADENFDNRILRGLLRRQPELDIVRVQDTEMMGSDDPTLLDWAAREGRILLTHDQRTIPRHALARIAAGKTISGVIVSSADLPVGVVIEDILLISEGSSALEWLNQIQRLPL